MMNSANDVAKGSKRKRRDTDDNRAERKRELDRIAQRATRERTKNRIADLEQRLASLESGDKNTEITQLTRTISELRQENARFQTALVKMRFAINEALGETESQNRQDPTRRDSSCSTADMVQSPPLTDNRGVAVTGSTLISTSFIDSIQPESNSQASATFTTNAQAQRLQPLYDTHGYRSPTPYEVGNIDISSIYEFFEYGTSNPFTSPSPLSGRLPPEGGFLQIAPDEHKWKTSDDAFNRGLAASPLLMDFDEGLLAKAILLGWNSIGAAVQNPLMSVLQCVDQRVFGKWTSRPQRLALMYICGCAMRWRASSTEENRIQVPPWFLPRPAQNRIEHPLVIDFLVWPGLRERLVFEYEKYTINGEFSYCFVEYFHFRWPFPDEQVAQYDHTGLICGLSKLFREFVFDLKNWTMLPGFFDSFPEMRADIDMWSDSPTVNYPKGHWTPSNPPPVLI